MGNQPLISVIVPVYNTEKYLKKCIDSVINQTYKNLDIILVDDGSIDNSGYICDEYAKLDKRIRIIHQENKGRTSVRKSGIKIAKGEYIGFVDSDDWIELDMYEYMMKMMMLHSVEMVSVGMICEHKDYFAPEPLYKEGVYRQDLDENTYDYENFIVNNNISFIYPSMCDKLHKRNLVEKFYLSLPDDLMIFEDGAYSYGTVPFLNSIYISNKYAYHYNRYNALSINNNLNIDYIQDAIKFYSYLRHLYSEHKHKETLCFQLNKYLLSNIISIMLSEKPNNIIKFIFRNIDKIPAHSKVVIYGAGEVGESYLKHLIKKDHVDVVAIVDMNNYGGIIDNMVVLPITDLHALNYDFVIIANNNEVTANQIVSTLAKEYKIEKSKLIWDKPVSAIDFITT